MPKLQISLLEHGEVTRELTDDWISVGRHTDNSIQIDDPSVSTHHAELRLKEGVYHLKDLGSTNGTRVNGDSKGEWELREGDRIQFGKVEALYVSGEQAPAPLPETELASPVAAAETSQRPASFTNASPFKSKVKEKNPGGTASMVLAIFAILLFVAAIVVISKIQP